MRRGEKAVRITLEFRSPGLCFDDAHGDHGPSALAYVEDLLTGMKMAIIEKKTLAIMSHSSELGKIPKHHTKKRRECIALYKKMIEIYNQERLAVDEALKTARYDVITNWNWDLPSNG